MEKGAWNHSDPGVTGGEGRFIARIPSGIFSQQLLHMPACTVPWCTSCDRSLLARFVKKSSRINKLRHRAERLPCPRHGNAARGGGTAPQLALGTAGTGAWMLGATPSSTARGSCTSSLTAPNPQQGPHQPRWLPSPSPTNYFSTLHPILGFLQPAPAVMEPPAAAALPLQVQAQGTQLKARADVCASVCVRVHTRVFSSLTAKTSPLPLTPSCCQSF